MISISFLYPPYSPRPPIIFIEFSGTAYVQVCSYVRVVLSVLRVTLLDSLYVMEQ